MQTPEAAGRWFQRLAPRPEAAVRLFGFHHAGGNASALRLWPRGLPRVDFCAVQLPGRAARLGEAPLRRLDDLVDALVPAIEPLLDRDYAFFGHSMGSALAFALAQRLHALGHRLPARLFVSARQPPHQPFPEPSVRGLSDAQLIDFVDQHFGGVPAEIRAVPEILELMLPCLHADFEALEAWPRTPPAPLPVPIVALGGRDDAWAGLAQLRAWQACTTRPLALRQFAGGHFYVDQALDDVLALVAAELAGVAEARETAP